MNNTNHHRNDRTPDIVCVVDLEVSPDPTTALLLNSRKPARGSSWAVCRIDVACVLVTSRSETGWKVDRFTTFAVDQDGAGHVSHVGDERGLLVQLGQILSATRREAAEEDRVLRLATYNGDAFDLPILRRRAMANGIFDQVDLVDPVDWMPYDVARHLARSPRTGMPKLKEVAAAFGIPATHQVARGPVLQYDRRAAKCEVDVCATLLLHAYDLAAAARDGAIVKDVWRALADEIGYGRMVPGHLAQFARHRRIGGLG